MSTPPNSLMVASSADLMALRSRISIEVKPTASCPQWPCTLQPRARHLPGRDQPQLRELPVRLRSTLPDDRFRYRLPQSERPVCSTASPVADGESCLFESPVLDPEGPARRKRNVIVIYGELIGRSCRPGLRNVLAPTPPPRSCTLHHANRVDVTLRSAELPSYSCRR